MVSSIHKISQGKRILSDDRGNEQIVGYIGANGQEHLMIDNQIGQEHLMIDDLLLDIAFLLEVT